ncbi:MAG: hypothetical protein CMQ34_09110 [Gammaproteobacteria bacterium]|nr:hypothetical protein [Gammaproteobacteria bacterium]|tara:strand:- start:3983 stop:4513 length:531 start_codon:yes stop_codon:yes gene_type:complete
MAADEHQRAARIIGVKQVMQRRFGEWPVTGKEQRTAWLALILTAMALLMPGQVMMAMLAVAEPALEALRQWRDSWWPWPASAPVDGGLALDKIIHFLLFAMCALLACRAWLSAVSGIYIALLLLAFAGFTEVMQYLVPGRSMSLGDMIADTLGILAGAGIWQGYRRVTIRPGSSTT